MTPEDAGFVLELLNEPDFLRYIGDKGVRTRADAEAYVETGPRASYALHGFGLLVMETRSPREPVGICGLLKRDGLPDPDLGFACLERFRRRGYVFEAAEAVLREARTGPERRRILAITSPDNRASIRLLERLGFVYERMASLAPGQPEVRLFVASG